MPARSTVRLLPLWSALLLIAGAAPAEAQSRAATERRLGGLQAQISGVEQQVRRARGEETSAIEALDALTTEISLREELLGGYRTQIETIRTETVALQGSIGRLESEIALAKSSYRDRARHAYMYGRRNALALILSAGSINQMLVRARYLQQFAGRRKSQVDQIGMQTAELRVREADVRQSLESTQRLLSQSQAETQTLALRRRERAALVAQVRSRRSDLERQLAQRRGDARDLESLVQNLIVRDRRTAESERVARAAAAAEQQARVRAAAEQTARAEATRQADLQRQADAAARRAAARRDIRSRPTPRREATPAFPTPVPEAPPVAVARPERTPRRAPTRPEPRPAPVPLPDAAPTPRTTPAPIRRSAPALTPRPAPAPEAPAPRPAPRPAPAPAPVPEVAVDLSGPFRSNRGRLPWPADGTVTGSFGTRTDPDYGTSINSIGIDISTRPAAPARAVFEGTVERVGTMATYGTFVMISHGDFTTVYGNLSQVVVAQGQRIRAGQTVGRAGTATDRRGSKLFFALFQDGRPANPTGWLRGR